MRNNNLSKSSKIISLVDDLPYFNLTNLLGIEKNKSYLKILLSRYSKSGKIIRLKKGFYVTKKYINEIQMKGIFSDYQEFIANIIYEPSYLSLDYILYKNNLMSEIPNNFTLVSKNKTAVFSNDFGNYFYHKITSKLYRGFEINSDNCYNINRASKSKALFDYLYLRKNQITDYDSFIELRLNLDNLFKKDLNEIKKYVDIEGSKKMKIIFGLLKEKNA
ncbi:MAG: hypothetical protein ACD_58C00132G0006 [uncultured bacterium]|nr:MAG: hypothetical protein ACD_58C00132G0006 [uncultured bacterium]